MRGLAAETMLYKINDQSKNIHYLSIQSKENIKLKHFFKKKRETEIPDAIFGIICTVYVTAESLPIHPSH